MKTRTIIKDQNGASAVEFALIMPLLFLLLFGIIEFGLLFYNKHIITNAAREGARYGIVVRINRYDNDAIKTKVLEYADKYLITFGSDKLVDTDIDIGSPDDGDSDNGDCQCRAPLDVTTAERCLTFGCDLKVVVNYDYDFLVLPAYLGFGQNHFNVVTVMRME